MTPVCLAEVSPDDDAFADWCAVRSASEVADRPGEAPRPAVEHVALGPPPGRSRRLARRHPPCGAEGNNFTVNAEDNAPMVAVNEALGSVPAGQLSSWSVRR